MPKQDVSVELFYDGAWHNLVTPDHEVLIDPPISVMRGNGDESAAPRPASIKLRLNNATDKYRTSNPMSPLYGKAGLNTPLRVSVGGAVRGYAEASSWEVDQTDDFQAGGSRGLAWVDVQAGGVLQRINQWTHNVKSPLRLASENIPSVSGYWALEDPAGATVASSTVPGTSNPTLIGHSFGSQNSPPGGGTAVDFGARAAGAYVFQPGNENSTGGWQLNRVIYLSEFTGGGALDPILGGQLLNGWSFFLQVNGDTRDVTITVADTTGAERAGASVNTAGYQWTGRWIMVHLQATYSAGTTTIGAYWQAVDDPDWSFFTDTWTGPTSDLWYAGAVLPPNSSYGHVIGTKGTADPLTSAARLEAFRGHDGERSAYRFGRLNDENNIPYYVSDSYDSSQSMGAQGADTLAHQYELLQTTEDALIFDHREEGAVFMLLRGDRLNQAPALTLDAAANPSGMPSLPAEVTDDLPVHNIVTASQVTGGDFTAEDSTSSMGSQDPPDGKGEYKQKVDVNVFDPENDLPQQAYWWLNRGTVDKPRFPQVVVDLNSLGSTEIAEVEQVDVGSVIEIVNFREYTIRLYVLGYTETIGSHTRTITFTCAPDDVFDAGQLDGGRRLQARATTLNADITSSATSLTLKMTDPDEQWRPGANAVPVLIGGEQITLGTVGAVSGSGPWTQSVTGCTRAVNGITKGHSAGDQVVVVGAIRLTLGEAS